MIPICLVTGFLGAGKTTFLQHVVTTHSAKRLVFLINEFASSDVDSALVHVDKGGVVAIPGGSIFCKCLVSEFIRHLRNLPETAGLSHDTIIDGVVIEASGIADPRVVQTMLRETGLDDMYALSSIVSVVDPGSLLKLMHTLPNIKAQIEAADIVLLNKVDMFDESQIDMTKGAVRTINPDARIVSTIRCQADVELFGEAPKRSLTGEYAACADPNYTSLAVSFTHPVDMDKLEALILNLKEDLYRAKGFVRVGKAFVYLDYSAAGLTVSTTDTLGARSELVFLLAGRAEWRSKQIRDQVQRGEVYE